MKIKKISLFKVVNVFMAVFCTGVMYANHVGVNLLSGEEAISLIGNDVFEYQITENTFSVHKNSNLVGTMPTNKKMKFKSSKPLLQPTAVLIAGKVIAAGIAAAATGGSFAAAAGAAMAGAMNAIGGAAAATGAAAVALPGAAAVEATIGGAGVAAAAAAAEAAAAGAGIAALTAIIVPVLVAAGVGAGLA